MKLKIKVTESNSAKIEAALHEVNGKATRHAFTEYKEVVRASLNGETRLAEIKLPKDQRAGAVWTATSGAPVPNSYNNKRVGTTITLVRITTGWELTNVEQVTLYKEGGGRDHLALMQRQYDEAAKRVMVGVEILES